MLDAAIVKRITNLREMAMMVVNEADEVLRLETPGEFPPGSSNTGGLTDSQRAKLLRKRRTNVARSTIQIQSKNNTQNNKQKS